MLSRSVNISLHEIIRECITVDLTEMNSVIARVNINVGHNKSIQSLSQKTSSISVNLSGQVICLTSCVLSRSVNISQHEIIRECTTGDLTEMNSVNARVNINVGHNKSIQSLSHKTSSISVNLSGQVICLTSCVLSSSVNISQHEIIRECITGDLTEMNSVIARVNINVGHNKSIQSLSQKLLVSVPTYQDNSFVFAMQ